jgi:hypothetical protein
MPEKEHNLRMHPHFILTFCVQFGRSDKVASSFILSFPWVTFVLCGSPLLRKTRTVRFALIFPNVQAAWE